MSLDFDFGHIVELVAFLAVYLLPSPIVERLRKGVGCGDSVDDRGSNDD